MIRESLTYIGVIVTGQFPESLLGEKALPVPSPLLQELCRETMEGETETVQTHGHHSLISLQSLVSCHHSVTQQPNHVYLNSYITQLL